MNTNIRALLKIGGGGLVGLAIGWILGRSPTPDEVAAATTHGTAVYTTVSGAIGAIMAAIGWWKGVKNEKDT